ncbi:unnamed protein product [Cochlearia groenlandica]
MVEGRGRELRESKIQLQKYMQEEGEESIIETSMELLLECCLNGEMTNYHSTTSKLQILGLLLEITITMISDRIEIVRVRTESLYSSSLLLVSPEVVSDVEAVIQNNLRNNKRKRKNKINTQHLEIIDLCDSHFKKNTKDLKIICIEIISEYLFGSVRSGL